MEMIFMEDDSFDLNVVLGAVEVLAEPIEIMNINQERREIPRNQHYVETVVPRYDDISFREHFRMSREVFQNLFLVVGHTRPGLRNARIELNKKLLYTIWILAKQESFLACGDRFGLARSTGYYVLQEIMSVLLEIMPQYITWPNDHRTAVNIFHERSNGFPGVIGAIYGCHIRIKQPTDNPHDYYNRNKYNSIILQGTADHNLKFIDIFVGMPGRMHDARVFRNSPIYRRITNIENPLLPPNLHILGDSAYPLMPNLMTPFRDNGHLNRSQVNYNTKLSSIRSVIERAFGRLKEKFRRLKDLEICDPDIGTSMIAAACVLHNFLIDNDHDDEDFEIDEEEIQQVDDNEVHELENREEAAIKRTNIMNIL